MRLTFKALPRNREHERLSDGERYSCRYFDPVAERLECGPAEVEVSLGRQTIHICRTHLQGFLSEGAEVVEMLDARDLIGWSGNQVSS